MHRPKTTIPATAFASHKLLAPSTLSCLVALFGVSAFVEAATLSEASVRSYMGEPLRARIGIVAGHDEDIGGTCFSVMSANDPTLVSKDYRVSVTDTRAARFLTIEGNRAESEPATTLRVRIGCENSSSATREFSLLLDVRPASRELPTAAPPPAPAAVIASAPAPVSTRVQVETTAMPSASAEPYWIARPGDTLRSIAQGIYPGNRARQAAYIAAMKKQNPQIETFPDQGGLPEGLALLMPSLKSLSGMPARAGGGATDTQISTARPQAREAPKPARPIAAKPAPTLATITNATATAAERAALAPIKTAPPAVAKNLGESFQLRLSSADLDISRSKNITEATRAKLREKLMLLDSDDHVAQLLSLRDTMKQMESRLTQLQAKLGAAPALESAPAVAGARVAEKRITVPVTPPPVVAAAPMVTPAPAIAAETKPAPAPAITPPATPAAEAKVETASAASDKPVVAAAAVASPAVPARRIPAVKATQPSGMDAFFADPVGSLGLNSTGGIAALAAALAALLGGAFWWRKARSKPYDPGRENALIYEARKEASSTKQSEARTEQQPDPKFDEWAEDKSAMEQVRAAAKTANVAPEQSAAPKARVLEDTNSLLRKSAAAEQVQREQSRGSPPTSATEYSETLILEPLEENGRGVLDVDVGQGASTMDVDLGHGSSAMDLRLDLDEAPKPARGARVKYMHERYPELAANTASVDRPSSLIDLARTYFREGYRVKACELLTYGIEERPQEVRFWLAQFEIFRLENLLPAFNTLAQKFEVLFGYDEAWAKVQHVGSVLDPSDALYIRSPDSPHPKVMFDPISDNWLNTPNDSPVEPLSSGSANLFGDALLTPQNIENISIRLSSLPGTKPV